MVESRASRRLPRRERLDRVLDTAQRLFYQRGVHEVGMDELVRETGLGKATVYRLYPTKDALVAAYLQRLAAQIFREIDGTVIRHCGDPAAALQSVLDAIEADLRRDGFRGCAFNNASVEFDDRGHPARVEARDYRQALLSRLIQLATELCGAERGGVLGHQLAVLIDGSYTNAVHLGFGGPAAAGLSLARDLVTAARAVSR